MLTVFTIMIHQLPPKPTVKESSFQRLINQYSVELCNIQANTNVSMKRTDVFEVFCGNESQLTKPVTATWFQGRPFQSTAGRSSNHRRSTFVVPKGLPPESQEHMVQPQLWTMEWFRMSERQPFLRCLGCIAANPNAECRTDCIRSCPA